MIITLGAIQIKFLLDKHVCKHIMHTFDILY